MRAPPLTALTFVKLNIILLGLFNVALMFWGRPSLTPGSPSAAEPRQILIRNHPSLHILQLDIHTRRRMLITEETVHYPIQGPLADLEWASLVPSVNHGLVLLDSDDAVRPYSISMFHSLRCLDRIRKAIVAPPSEDPQTRFQVHHCFNYLRQMVLCAANTRLNPINHVDSSGRVASDGIGLAYQCRDWDAVYEAFEANVALNRTLSFS